MPIASSVLESVAKALSEAHDVRVIFYGDECCTDGKTIYLPSLPDKVSEDVIMLLRGFLDHEAGHIAFTNFRDYKGLPKNKTEQFALNAIEDIRIELKMESIWKGCKVNFERSHEYSIKKILDPKGKGKKWEDYDPVTKIFLLFISVARYGYDSEIFVKHSTEYSPVIDELTDEIEESKELNSTKEAYKLAVRVLEKIEHIVKKKLEAGRKKVRRKVSKKDPKKGKGAEKSKRSKETDSTAEKPDKDKDEEPTDGDSGKDKPEKSEDEGKEKEKGKPDDSRKPESFTSDDTEDSDSGDFDTGDDTEDDDFFKSLREALESDEERKLPDISDEISEKASRLKGYRVLTTKKDSFIPYPVESRDRGLEKYERNKRDTHGVVGVLKNKLNRLLMSKKRSTWEGGKRNGLINPATLHMAVQGTSDKLYRHRKEGTRINTAVSILVDLSGSMGGRKVEKACETVVLLAEALFLINVSFEILGFSGDRYSNGYTDKFSRYGSLDMFYFKLFSEPLNQTVKNRIGSINSHSQNYDGESVRFAALRLLKRPEPKKVLFVLSDGEPAAAHCKSRTLDPHLKQVCGELESLKDFYLCGFGILTDAPRKFYKNHVLVDDLASLPKVLMENLYRAFI